MTPAADRCIQEIKHCWQLGASVSDRTAFAFDTLRVHLENPAAEVFRPRDQNIKHKRIHLPQLPGRPVDYHHRVSGDDLKHFHQVHARSLLLDSSDTDECS